MEGNASWQCHVEGSNIQDDLHEFIVSGHKSIALGGAPTAGAVDGLPREDLPIA